MIDVDFRDLALLKGFIDGNHFTKATGLLQKDINLDRANQTIYKRLVRLEAKGYVDQGYRITNANTYFITKKGIEFYQEAIN